MAILNTLPSRNLKAVDIRDTIGCPSNNLADYCCKAKSGGSGGYAFQIVENGYGTGNGTLVATYNGSNAVPYFNIWSKNSPGEWVYANDANNYKMIHFRLKRNVYGDVNTSTHMYYNNLSYCFDLGAFKGYVHNSSAPIIQVASLLPTVDEESGTSSSDITIFLSPIDWAYVISTDKSNFDRSNYYIRLYVTSSYGDTYSQYYNISTSSYMQIPINGIPIADTYQCRARVYENIPGVGMQSRGLLPLTKSNSPFVIYKNVDVKLFNIIYVPRITVHVRFYDGSGFMVVEQEKMTLYGLNTYAYLGYSIPYKAQQVVTTDNSTFKIDYTQNISGSVSFGIAEVMNKSYSSSTKEGTMDLRLSFNSNVKKGTPMPHVHVVIDVR